MLRTMLNSVLFMVPMEISTLIIPFIIIALLAIMMEYKKNFREKVDHFRFSIFFQVHVLFKSKVYFMLKYSEDVL